MQGSTAVVVGLGLIGLLAAAGGSRASASTGPDEGEREPKPKPAPTPPPSKLAVPRLAERLAYDVRDRGYDYDRQWCRDFQASVSIEADGIYGPATAAALRVYVPDAPDALFKPKAGVTATPSPKSSTNAPLPDSLVVRLAKKVAGDIRARAHDYDRQWVKDFQVAAALEADGIYGPLTAAAIEQYAPPAPPVLYKPKPGTAAAQKTAAQLGPRKLTVEQAAQNLAETDDEVDMSELDDETVSQIETANLRRTTGQEPGSAQERAAPFDSEGMNRALRAAQLASGMTPTPRVREGAPATPGELALPPTPINLELARREAPTVAKHLRQKKKSYSRQLLKDFQKHAGIKPDGLYGPISRSALAQFGVVDPPMPFVNPKGVATYSMPSQ